VNSNFSSFWSFLTQNAVLKIPSLCSDHTDLDSLSGIGTVAKEQTCPSGHVWQICHTFQNSGPEVYLLVDFYIFRTENSMRVIWFYTPSS
jgi:hypothetical protein